MQTLHSKKALFADAQRLFVSDLEEWLRCTRAAIANGKPSDEIKRRAAIYLRKLRAVCDGEEVAAEYGWTDPLFQPRQPTPFRADRHWVEKGLQWKPF